VIGKGPVALQRGTVAKHVDGWNSLNHVQIIMGVERDFDIKIALPELMRVANVGDLLDLIGKKVAS
jgi:acyl carrier protein